MTNFDMNNTSTSTFRSDPSSSCNNKTEATGSSSSSNFFLEEVVRKTKCISLLSSSSHSSSKEELESTAKTEKDVNRMITSPLLTRTQDLDDPNAHQQQMNSGFLTPSMDSQQTQKKQQQCISASMSRKRIIRSKVKANNAKKTRVPVSRKESRRHVVGGGKQHNRRVTKSLLFPHREEKDNGNELPSFLTHFTPPSRRSISVLTQKKNRNDDDSSSSVFHGPISGPKMPELFSSSSDEESEDNDEMMSMTPILLQGERAVHRHGRPRFQLSMRRSSAADFYPGQF